MAVHIGLGEDARLSFDFQNSEAHKLDPGVASDMVFPDSVYTHSLPTSMPGASTKTCIVDPYSDLINVSAIMGVNEKLDRLIHDVQLLHLYADLDKFGLKRSKFNL